MSGDFSLSQKSPRLFWTKVTSFHKSLYLATCFEGLDAIVVSRGRSWSTVLNHKVSDLEIN